MYSEWLCKEVELVFERHVCLYNFINGVANSGLRRIVDDKGGDVAVLWRLLTPPPEAEMTASVTDAPLQHCSSLSSLTRSSTSTMTDNAEQPKERFAPKQQVNLAPPKDDVITQDYLSKCDGEVP